MISGSRSRSDTRTITPTLPVGAAVLLLGVVALALRLVLAGDDLAGDELFARYDVIGGGPADVVQRLREGAFVSPEVSPPLYFLLAWAAHAVVPVDEALRAPSVIASTITVWLVFALGRRVAHEGAGLVAAACWALAPFAIFYGSEARPYALLRRSRPVHCSRCSWRSSAAAPGAGCPSAS